MRSVLLGAVGCLAIAGSLTAQEPLQSYAGVTSYVLSFPTGDSRHFVTSPSWLSPLKRPVCRPYVVAGIPGHANKVTVKSVIFMGPYNV